MQLNVFFSRNDKSNIKKAQIYLCQISKLVESKAIDVFSTAIYFCSSLQITELNSIHHISTDVRKWKQPDFSQELNKVKRLELERFFLSELKVTMFVSIFGYGDIEIDHLFVQPFPSFSTLSVGPGIKRIMAA